VCSCSRYGQFRLATLERLASRNDAPAVLQQLRVIVFHFEQDSHTASVPAVATA